MHEAVNAGLFANRDQNVALVKAKGSNGLNAAYLLGFLHIDGRFRPLA